MEITVKQRKEFKNIIEHFKDVRVESMYDFSLIRCGKKVSFSFYVIFTNNYGRFRATIYGEDLTNLHNKEELKQTKQQ